MQAGTPGSAWLHLGGAFLMVGVVGIVTGVFAFLGILLAVKRPLDRLPIVIPVVLLFTCLCPFALVAFLMSWLGGWLYLKVSQQSLLAQRTARGASSRFSLRSAFSLTLTISVFLAIGRMLRLANLGLPAVLLAISVLAAIAVWSSFRSASSFWLAPAYWLSTLGIGFWLIFATGQAAAGAMLMTSCLLFAHAATVQALLRRLRRRGDRLAPARPSPLSVAEQAGEDWQWIPWATYQPKQRPTL